MDKVVAITGAYRGLGAALSRALAKKGYKLVLGGRDKQELEKFTAEISKLTEAEPVAMDVRKKDDCWNFINAAVKRFGRLDILINNAGILHLVKIEDITEEDLKDAFETHAFGPIFCAQAAVPIMKKQGSGCIASIGSATAVDYHSSNIPYGASKAALMGFTGSLRKELEGTGIRTLVFSPAGMKTDLFRRSPRDTSEYMDPAFVADKIIKEIENPSEEWNFLLKRPNL